MSAVRVLHVIDRLSGGGAEESLAVFLEHADLDLRAHHRAAALIESSGVGGPSRPTVGEVVSLERPKSLNPGDVKSLRRVVLDYDPHVIHSSLFRSNLVASLCRGKTPQIVTLTSTEYAVHAPSLRLKQRFGLGASHRAYGWLLKRSRVHVHAVSEAVSRSGQQVFGLRPEEISVIPRGRADVKQRMRRTRDDVRRELGLVGGEISVGMIAREHRLKNHVGFLEALAAAIQQRPNIRVILAGGPGNGTSDIDEAIECLGLSGRVSRLGHRDDVPDLLAALDVLACTSHSEGMPGGIIEGFAASLPVLAYDAPGVDEAVGRGHPGLVPFGDREAFADALVSLADDPDQRVTWGALGRARYEQEFTLQAYAGRITDLYVSTVTPTR